MAVSEASSICSALPLQIIIFRYSYLGWRLEVEGEVGLGLRYHYCGLCAATSNQTLNTLVWIGQALIGLVPGSESGQLISAHPL